MIKQFLIMSKTYEKQFYYAFSSNFTFLSISNISQTL